MSRLLSKQRNYFKAFFGSRMPVSDKIVLQQRSTYILPTKAGFLMLGIILLMMVAATNYQNNLAYILTFLTASIGLVSILFTFKNLQGLSFKIGTCESVCVGERLLLSVHVKSQSHQSHSTIGVGVDSKELSYINVSSQDANRVSIGLAAEQRGWLTLPRLMATSSFPFGLLKAWAWFRFSTPILIYPKPVEPPAFSGINDTSELEENAMKRGVEDLYGLKTYQPGEPISRIDWKALAREKGIFTKEFVDYQSQELVFQWNDFKQAGDEDILSYLCFLVLKASESNFDYALNLPGRSIPKNSGAAHLTDCLRALGSYGQKAPI